MKDKALWRALEVLEELQGGCTDHNDGTVEAITVWCPEVIEEIKIALAKPAPPLECKTEAEQTAYAFGWWKALESVGVTRAMQEGKDFTISKPWVNLTDEGIFSVLGNLQAMYNRPPTEDSRVVFARAIEAKLKELNK